MMDHFWRRSKRRSIHVKLLISSHCTDYSKLPSMRTSQGGVLRWGFHFEQVKQRQHELWRSFPILCNYTTQGRDWVLGGLKKEKVVWTEWHFTNLFWHKTFFIKWWLWQKPKTLHPPQTKECLSGLPLNGRLERSKILQYLIYYQELLTYVLLE